MTTTASAPLVTALKNSLADSNAGWLVRSVREVSSVAFTVVEGLTNGTAAVDMIIRLEAPALRSGVGGRTHMALTVTSTKVDGAFAYVTIADSDGEWRTTDSALNTTITGLAATFLSARDAALKNALVAGPVSDNTTIPAGQLSALIASLADPAHGWTCRSVTRLNGQLVASLGTMSVKVAPVLGLQPVPISLSYVADLAPDGSLISAKLMFGGPEWLSRSTTLHASVVGYADQFLASQSTALTAALTAGP